MISDYFMDPSKDYNRPNEHQEEAAEILSNDPAYVLGYSIGLIDDLVNGPTRDRKWSRERAKAIVAEWARKHPGSPTAKKVEARR